ncbi:MAG: magnesium transporter CorA family protein [bacterium]
MINKYKFRKLTWIDVESPTPEEIRKLVDEHGIAPLVAEELLVPNMKPKVDVYPNHLYLILRFPSLKKNDGIDPEDSQEIDFVIGKNFIITAHYDHIEQLSLFSKMFEVNSILDRSPIGDHAGFIFYYMIKNIYHHLLEDLEYARSTLLSAEKKVFHGEEKQMVFKLSEINRDILFFKEALNLHLEVLTSFENAGKKFFGEEFDYYLRDIIGEFYKVQNATQNIKDFLEELRRTNDSLLSTKQNEVMKTFTIIAFIFLPLSFIASIFSMRLSYTPLQDSPNGFYQVISIMAAVGILTFALFKWKKWL